MSNLIIGFPNRIDEATLSGGSWLASLPITKLQNRALSQVARSTDAALTSTTLTATFTAITVTKLLALVNHNLSVAAKIRLHSYDASYAEYDSGWIDVWPSVYLPDELEWEDDTWWTGQYSAAQRENYTPIFIHILPQDVYTTNWIIEINDTTNAAGYVQIGRAFIGAVWQPAKNMIYGVEIGWESRSEVSEALSGAEFMIERRPHRSARLHLEWMPEAEAYNQAFELTRQADVHKEVVFVYDPDDTARAIQRQYIGRLRKLSPIEHPFFAHHSMEFEIKELLP